MVSVMTLFYALGMAEWIFLSAMLVFCTEFTFGHVDRNYFNLPCRLFLNQHVKNVF